MGSINVLTPKLERTMLFIDGGYLRKGIRDLLKDDKIDLKIDYKKLYTQLTPHLEEGLMYPQLVRAYYYDGIPLSQKDPKYDPQKEYTDKINRVEYYEVRLARVKESKKEGYKQKGVDVLLTIDMLQKAYEDQYQWAMLLTGDDDYLDLVQAVKHTGKRVYGFYFGQDDTSQELIDSFDKRIMITDNLARSFLESGSIT